MYHGWASERVCVLPTELGRQLAHTISGKYILEPQKTKVINHLKSGDEGEGEWEVIIAVDGAMKNRETMHLDICIRLLYFVSLFLSLSSFFLFFFLFLSCLFLPFQHWDWLYTKKAYS
ncbi:hypothetical protein M441DRAFT_259479 [Trichoderma asperellum CBS 433.97]|uniref:Uncharacterized protein n=1 Tax=Trichoderma asperellum (strain ATCC 204424 / CBS 433.97 / NBRC 101777) TaxID=1042311 RepID=A0A2T3YZD3_TRIA4|nr:hypothetical protein M441DRAFT_259479 [Trichoderma asperellum CBS 433.97]PTB37870.1 hypothetical protein M441DRAFT_259479 [Trichoderma asperellum CBS 433.97]